MTIAPLALTLCLLLILVGAAIQVAVGAGMSVVCGPFLLLWIGPALDVPILLCLNLLVSVVATACGGLALRWGDVALASLTTLAGCGLALAVPTMPGTALTLITAATLIAVALPRPPSPDAVASPRSVAVGVTLAGVLTGALTVWTATPGPVMPVALARAGRSGSDIRRTMQPVSTLGYGVGFVLVGPGPLSAVDAKALASLVIATLIGTGAGLALRTRIAPAQVVLLVRIVAGVSAVLLLASLLR